MLKNKFAIITLLTVIILALTLPIVRAENETAADVATPDGTASENTPNPDIAPISEEEPNSETPTTNATDESFKKSDVYLTGDDVTIDYIVDGNLFVAANHVTINSQIGGDAFICANTVTIGEQGYIFSNLFTFAKNVTVNGVVYDLYSASENTTINGYIYRDIRVGSNTLNIFGTIGRNAYVECDNLNFTQDANTDNAEANNTNTKASITGNLTYSANSEFSIPEGIVTGQTTFNQKSSFDGNTIQDQIMKLGTFVITIVAVWLVCLWLAPKFLKNTTAYLTSKKVLPAIGFGILTPIVLVVLAILFFILGITSTLGLLLFLVLFALMAISTSVFAITLNTIICDKLNIEKTIGIFGMLIVTSIALWLIGLIPYIGSVLGIIVVVLGLGIVTSSLVLRKKEITE